MNVDDIRTLYAYNRWANQRLLSAVRLLQPMEFIRDFSASFGSVRGTVAHIAWGEWLWVRRWRGESPKQVFDPEKFPAVESLESTWDVIERDQRDFIAGLSQERLSGRVSYENFQGDRWEYSLGHMMQHLVNHSSYHRGQVAALLRQLGQIPPTTDFLVYLDEVALSEPPAA